MLDFDENFQLIENKNQTTNLNDYFPDGYMTSIYENGQTDLATTLTTLQQTNFK
jgi:hypothetical protein